MISRPEDPCFSIPEDAEDPNRELTVTFHPPLYQQRRIWILDMLRAEKNLNSVLDVGCGEGQLLVALCQPSPWLAPPPESVLHPADTTVPPTVSPTNPTFTTTDDPIPNLHISKVMGLDISEADLKFAIEGTLPPPPPPSPIRDVGEGSSRGDAPSPAATYAYLTGYGAATKRWEETVAEIWKGKLEIVNEDFIGLDCIVSSEVIEHLPPDVLPAFASMLLGVYHPRLLLITTPSYTYNARFTPPNAPPSARKGYKDPTGRTDRIFRHDDHKFEWTVEEFHSWCTEQGQKWGYVPEIISSVGRACERDEWGRDETIGGASQIAAFRRIDDERVAADREKAAKAWLAEWQKEIQSKGDEKHERLAKHEHIAHQSARKPVGYEEIGECVLATMERCRENFMRLEEFWYDGPLSEMCGGWLEILAHAVTIHPRLHLFREEMSPGGRRGDWMVELKGGSADTKTHPKMMWPGSEDLGTPDESVEHMPIDWIPEEEAYEESPTDWDSMEAIDGDVSWDDDFDEGNSMEVPGWGDGDSPKWKNEKWIESSESVDWSQVGDTAAAEWAKPHHSVQPSTSSSTGWEADEDEDDGNDTDATY